MNVPLKDLTVSVVYVTWNRRDVLCESIQSVLNASGGTKPEIVLVDNGSTDGTVEAVNTKFPFVKVIRLHKNFGPTAARNIAIANASGDIVMCFDDDLVVQQDILNQILQRFKNDRKLGALALKVVNSYSGKIESDFYPGIDASAQDLYVCGFFSEGAVAFRKNAFIKAGSYCDEYFRQGESYELSRRFFQFGFRIMYAPEIVVFHKETALMRNTQKINWYSVRNTVWNDLLEHNGIELIVILPYRTIKLLFVSLKNRLPLRSFCHALYHGFFKVPWRRKIRMDKKAKNFFNHLKIIQGLSREEFESFKPKSKSYISYRLKKLMRTR